MIPDLKKLENLFLTCSKQQDQVAKRLLEKKIDILNGNFTFSCHRNCTATYASPLHLKRYSNKSYQDEDSPSASCPVKPFTRSQFTSQDFDWKKNCFLCGGECNPKQRSTWSVVHSSTGFKSDQSDMYTRVLKAAEACNDSEMLFCLHEVHNGDIVAVKARYHRAKNCYTKYISQHGINTESGHREANDSYRCVVIQLITEFQPPIIDDKKKSSC